MNNIPDFSGLQGSFTIQDSTIAKLQTGRLALLDADRVKYVVAHRIYKIKKENELAGRDDIYLSEPLYVTETRKWVEEWLSKIDDTIVFCFSDTTSNNFRSKIVSEKEYKGSRKGKVDPYDYPGKYEDMKGAMLWIIENYNSLIADELEADDIVSILQDQDNTYIISNDKDLKQVVGYHYDETINNIVNISPKEALLHLVRQMITGDSTDDIVGIPRKGPKYADKFLEKHKDSNIKYLLQYVLEEYQLAYNSITKGAEAFAENLMLIKMKSDRGDYFKKKYAHLFDKKQMLLSKIKENQE